MGLKDAEAARAMGISPKRLARVYKRMWGLNKRGCPAKEMSEQEISRKQRKYRELKNKSWDDERIAKAMCMDRHRLYRFKCKYLPEYIVKRK